MKYRIELIAVFFFCGKMKRAIILIIGMTGGLQVPANRSANALGIIVTVDLIADVTGIC